MTDLQKKMTVVLVSHSPGGDTPHLQKIMTVVSHSPGGDTPHLQISQPAQHEKLQQCHW